MRVMPGMCTSHAKTRPTVQVDTLTIQNLDGKFEDPAQGAVISSNLITGLSMGTEKTIGGVYVFCIYVYVPPDV